MKTLILICLIASFSITYSQDCTNYYYLQKNKTIEMSIYDKRGDESGKLVYSVGDVTNADGFTTASVKSEMFDKKGRTIAKGNSVMRCNSGVMMIDMKVMIPTPQAEMATKANAKADEYFVEYPANMSKGDLLKDGSFNMDWDNNGLPQSITMNVFDRKVEDKETITTPAGSWDCYKISYRSKMSIKMAGVGIPVNMDGTEWYAPGFGIIKSTSKHGSTVITSIK